MMALIEVTCRLCGHIFGPTREECRRGLWHTCASCRDGPDTSKESGSGVQPRHGPGNDSQTQSVEITRNRGRS